VEHLVPQLLPGIDVVEMLHPSPRVLNTKRDNRGKILATLLKVAGMLGAEVQQLTDA
jgi:uracil-DNA glycosylase